MGSVLHYITTAVARTGAQLLVLFGILFVLAVVLWFVSQGIRGMLSSRIGMVRKERCLDEVIDYGIALCYII